jgi:hypothetical protein
MKLISQHETKNQIKYLDLFGIFSKPNLTLQAHNTPSQIYITKLDTIGLCCNNLGLCDTLTITLYILGTN